LDIFYFWNKYCQEFKCHIKEVWLLFYTIKTKKSLFLH
jgi:mRNA-degrading endonuclease YafQ of YafQ-DinJ toxin-antitoxin module